MIVDARAWSKLNLWPLPSGELAVRPGLRRILTPDAQRMLCGGFSVLNQFTGEVWHYIFDCTSSVSSNRDLRLRIYDEDFQIFQALSLNVNVDPRVITHGVYLGQLLICSPDFPPLWGLTGSGVIFAKKVASANPNTTALAVPRGICCTFGNRFVIADGPSLFFSDPISSTGGDARTFVAQNQNTRPAPIFGLHEGANDQLVVLTQRGTYAVPSSFGAAGIVGSNGTAWAMLNHHKTHTFASSAAVNGRIFALSQKGYRLVDVEGDREEALDDPVMPRFFGPRIAADDWRAARMFEGSRGPVVSHGDACSMHDLDRQTRSWWRCNVGSTFRVRGMLETAEGEEMLLAEDGVYMLAGNFDGDTTITPAATQPKGVLYGRIDTDPGGNPMARELRVCASVGGEGKIYFAVRGDKQEETPPADNRTLVEGTSSWGVDATKVWEPAPLAQARGQFALPTHEVTVEVAVDFPLTRIGPVFTSDESASSSKRPTNRGV